MTGQTDRRTLLKSALGGAALATAPGFARMAFAAGEGETIPLNERMAVISGLGANVVALATTDGAVLVDSGAEGQTDALLNRLGDLPGPGRAATVINTHYHAPQTGGNAALGEAGAKIIAHKRTERWLSRDYYVPFEDRWVSAAPQAAWPTETFYETGSLDAGAERIDYGYLQQAHTAGDIYVFFRGANVIAVGDIASPVRDPALDWFSGGWLGGRMDAMAKILELADEETRIVPSFGPVMSRADFQAETDMMNTIWERTTDMLQMGYSARDMLEEGALEGLPRTFEDPMQFLYDNSKGLWAHASAIAHEIV